ncbi:MAG: tetratricopeptide repeat protein [candidate division KSB1 bacterium]|nr:tetratricopeptide repeat protein [candidate division KSB1 bacterium]
MRRILLAGSLPLALIGVLAFVGCQTKEVTSAKVYIQQDDWDKAIEQLQMAVKMYPNDPEAHYLLGEGYAVKGDYDGMNREFEASLAISPKFEPQIRASREKYWIRAFNSGVNKFNARAYDEAARDFLTATRIDPSRPEAYVNGATAFLVLDSLPRAVEVAEEGLQHSPNDPKLLTLAGDIYLRTERYDQAISVLEKAVAVEPNNANAIANLARAYHSAGKGEQALETYRRALQSDPENTDLIFNMALLHFSAKRYDQAAECFAKVIEKNPDDYEANWRLAVTYLVVADSLNKPVAERLINGEEVPDQEIKKVQQAYGKAIPYLEKCTQLKPDDADLWLYLGQAYVRSGNAAKGEEAFKREKELRGEGESTRR